MWRNAGSMLGTIHNLRYYQRFTQDIRDALDNELLMPL
jgi:queuine tRNA-ribosyltransferase